MRLQAKARAKEELGLILSVMIGSILGTYLIPVLILFTLIPKKEN